MSEPIGLDAIKARLVAATPGPWRYYADKHYRAAGQGPKEGVFSGTPDGAPTIAVTGPSGDPQSMLDAEFIAHAPTDIAALVAEVERLQGVCLSESRGQLCDTAALVGMMVALGLVNEVNGSPGWDGDEGTAPAYRWGRAHGAAKAAEVDRLQGEASAAFGEQMRAEGERDAARRELAEIREAIGDLVGAAGGRTLAETVASLARFATDTAGRLATVLDERDLLRALAYPSPLPLSEAAGDGPAMLWWRSAPISEPPCYIGHPGDSGWPFTADDAPIWVPLPEIVNDAPKEPAP